MNQKQILAATVALVGGVGLSIAAPWNPKAASMDPIPIIQSQKGKSINRNADMETRKSNLHLDAAGVKHIKLTVQIGEVVLTTNSSSNFDAQITKGVSRPITDKERKWLDNPWLKARRDGDTIIIYEDKDLKPDFHEQDENSRNHRDIDLTLNIQIPSGLDADVSLLAGDVKIDGDYRMLSTKIAAGQLSLDHFRASDSIKINLEAGQVDAKLTESPLNDSKIRVAVGEVNLDLKGNATVNARASIGSISYSGDSKHDQKGLGDKRKLQFGSGGSTFIVEVDAGDINFGKTKVTRAEHDKDSDDDMDTSMSDIDLNINQDKNIDVHGEISRALKAAQIEMDGKDIKGEIDRAMKEVQRELDSKDIKGEISRALKQAQIEIDGKDFEGEIERAMKEARIEMNSSMKESDLEMNQAIKEIDRAIKELDQEMKSNHESEGQFRNIGRDALVIAKHALEHSRDAMKKAKSTARTRKN